LLGLSWGDLNAETESEIIAAQDQALQTKSYAKRNLKQKQTVNADYVKNVTRQ
jgi:hypothetical protein